MVLRAGLAAVILLTALPMAAASDQVTLRLEPEGPITLVAADARGPLLGAYTESPSGIEIECAEMRITRFHYAGLAAGILEVPTTNASASYVVHNATLAITEAAETAWLGAYPSSAPTVLHVSAAASLSRRDDVVLGNAPSTPEDTPRHNRPSFGLDPTGPVLAVAPAGRAELDGPIAVKMAGVLAEVDARENTSTIDVRQSATTSDAQRDRRWAVVTCEDGTLAGWQGDALVSDWGSDSATKLEVYGERSVVQQGRASTTEAGSASFEGDFAVLIVPDANDVSRVQARIDGTVASPPLTPANALLAKGRSWAPWAAGILIAGAVALVVRARLRTPELTIDELVDLANQAAAEERFQVALEWQERALRLAPDHPRLLVDAGYFLSELGRLEEARDTLLRAAARGTDGEAELLLVRMHLTTGIEVDDVTRLVVEAVEKSPWNLLELESDPTMARLLDAPAAAACARRARRKLDPEP